MVEVKKFYNLQASKWFSNNPRTISDLIGRPAVYDLCKKYGKNKIFLDLGCGEGYFSRQISKFAKKVIGIDISKKMIEIANKNKGINEEYHISDMKSLKLAKESIDIVVAIFSLNYLKSKEELNSVFHEINKVLKKNGKLIFLVPHPLGSLINEKSKWYIHPKLEFNYKKDEGKFFKYKNNLLNGEDSLEVGFYFHRLETYSECLDSNNFAIKKILEPSPSKELSKKYPVKTEEKIPYYLIIEAIKW
jgi:ubiquinone/menaquinone biosynthesis C-methylase UbiE